MTALRLTLAFLLLWFALPLEVRAAEPLKGVALVIGQSKYQALTPLPNPARDAAAISALLEKLGFETETIDDRRAKRLAGDIADFTEDAAGADVALVYYAGHAIEAAGENFLIPVDAGRNLEAQGLVSVSRLLAQLRLKAKIVIVLLDACRTSPYPPGTSLVLGDGQTAPVAAQGLSAPRGFVAAAGEPGDAESLGALIGFAAAPGETALDGAPGAHSPYAAALLKHFGAAGATFSDVMTMVAEEVYLETGGRQQPWVNASLRRLLTFDGSETLAGDEARIRNGRRELLLTIGALPGRLRRTVETLAHQNDLPLAPLYGMLKQLQIDVSGGPEEFDKQLKAGAESLKKLLEERDTVERTDPEIVRLTSLADRAQNEGAIALALDYRAAASARARDVAKALRDTEEQLKARHLEVAATFAKEAGTATVAFDHRRASSLYALAFAEVGRWDPLAARRYKWAEADALERQGVFKGDTPALSASIAAYRAALALYPRETDANEWASLHNSLGSALWRLGLREAGTERLRAAIAAYQAALTVWGRARSPAKWAMVENNMALALAALGNREEQTIHLQEAIATFRAVLEVWTRQSAPFDWALAQSNLASTLDSLGLREAGTERYREAVVAHRAALEVYSRDAVPLEWARTQNNLGMTLSALGLREEGTASLEQAVIAFRLALEERTRDRLPIEWARTQHALGIALWTLGGREGGTAMHEEAAAALRLALLEWTRERVPLDWAGIQNNLGLILWDLGNRQNSAARLEESIAAFRLALAEVTPDRGPRNFAMVQGNLAGALLDLGRMTADRTLLLEARAAIEMARDTDRPLGDPQRDKFYADIIADIDAALK